VLPCVALLLLLAACGDRGPLSPPTLEPLLVHVDGSWLRDAKGRVVLLRGVNVVYTEGTPQEEQRAPREQDFAFLASLGLNFVRLPVAWASVEPRPGLHDVLFLRDRVDPILRAASDHGMPVMLALHQVRWSSCFLGGSGAPPWTCAGADVTQQPRQGWAARDAIADMRAARAQCDFYRDAKAPDGVPLRAHYAATWSALAHYYEQDRRILGFDLLNEPSPGNCFTPDTFLATVLSPFYEELVRRVRDAGAPQAIVYQPAVARGDAMLGVPADPAPRSIFAPHLFGQAFGAPSGDGGAVALLDASYTRASALAETVGGPLVVGEIGGDAPPDGTYRPATREFLAASLDELDRRLLSGAVWAFLPQESPPEGSGPGIGNPSDAAVLARPFARRIAGIPREMGFDAETGEFHLRFVDDAAVRPPDPSEIFVPASRRYPRGFEVDVTAGDRWTYDTHNQRVLLYRGPGSTHEVTIRPAPHGGAAPSEAAVPDAAAAD
jgi:endoglycosylceramidase